jgi:uncharacterized protein (UPF0264 family)
MTHLMVSVRSPHEAALALAAGADLIDVKEPRLGSLGRAGDQIIREVLDVVSGRAPVSIALGDLSEFDSSISIPSGVSFAKIGTAHCRDDASWTIRYRAAFESFPKDVRRVAVAYADATLAQSPDWNDVLDAASATTCAALLVDTFVKGSGDVFAHLSPAELDKLLRRAGSQGLMTVVAGSLNRTTLPLAMAHGPDLVAVRGAVCRSDRAAAIDPPLLQALVDDFRRARGTSLAVASSRFTCSQPMGPSVIA